MPGLIDRELFAVRQADRRQQSPPPIGDVPRHLDALGAQLGEGGVNVITHQVQLMTAVTVGRMHRQLGRRQGDAGKVSCAGCHLPSAGFVDNRSPHRQVSLAAQWTLRRTPTLLEIAFAPLYNWDGRRDSIWSQAIGVMESHAEFNSGRLFVAEQISRLFKDDYEAIFGALPALDDAQRFPQLTPTEAGCVERSTMSGAVYDCRGKPGDGADYDALSADDQRAVTRVIVNTTKTIEAYVRRLRCGASRFDRWLAGDAQALTETELAGYRLFNSLGCISCHKGVNVGGNLFARLGVFHPLATPAVTSLRVPSLRNVAATEPYFHDGSAPTLANAVKRMARAQLDQSLSDQQIVAIVAFLGTLTGTYRGAAVVAASP